ncbi:MAG: histone deacetylase [Polyangiaceae bacterium]|nr:histone deacetylase [Polyangiaceae bacterium]
MTAAGDAKSGRTIGQNPRTILVADDRLFDEHRPRGYHPERPERLGAARRALFRAETAGIPTHRIETRDAALEQLYEAHDRGYVDALVAISGREARVDADTYVGVHSIEAARRAAGSASALVEHIIDSPEAPLGLALLRPPGHHATRDTGMGFCLFNNAAVAAYSALKKGLSRVAIIDWDVHHGNGTQDIFWNDGRVLYLSLHQFPFYPGTGAAEEVGEGEGKGATVNVPLSAGAGDAVYTSAFHEVVEPVLHDFAPELIIVSAGFDAHERDPLASMRVTAEGYACMARSISRAAASSAKSRIAVLLEGGYDLGALEDSLFETLSAFTTSPGTAAREPAFDEVTPAQRREISDARRIAHRAYRSV